MSVKHHITIFSTTTLLMLGVYTAFVGFFFFTYGAYTEKKVVGNQIFPQRRRWIKKPRTLATRANDD